MSGVTAIVLAAGASTRMGQQKLVMPYGRSTILNSTISAVSTSGVERVVVVTGHDAELVEASITDDRAVVVRNLEPGRGNMSSLLTGVEASPDAEAFLLMAGDLPTVRSSEVNRLVELWRASAPYAAMTEYTNRIAHPFLLSWAAISDAMPHEGDKVLWRLLIESGDRRVVRVPAGIPAPVDVNSPSDLEDLSAG